MSTRKSSQVDQFALEAALAAPVAAAAPDAVRAGWLHAVAEAIEAGATELVELAEQETHLPRARLEGELIRTTNQLRLFGQVITEGSYLEVAIDHARADTVPPQPDLRRMLRPIGPVAVFAASNFPFAFSVSGGDTASALAVGCPVIVKTHPGHPLVSRLTSDLVHAGLASVGAPEGVFRTVEGFSAGQQLVQHPAVSAVAFTGSTAGGRALFDIATQRENPIPFFGELGSVNPVVVLPAADRARGSQLAEGLVASVTGSGGQLCTKPGVVFVPHSSQLEANIASLPSKTPLLNSVIEEAFATGIDRALHEHGAQVIAGEVDGPVVLGVDDLSVLRHPELIRTEIFGPATLLVRYSAATLPALLQLIEGSLTGTIHADPEDNPLPIARQLETKVGRVLFDGWPTGVAVTWSQHHGGPWPATTAPFTSVGATAVRRFLRPVVYQNAPRSVLHPALWEENPLRIPRRVDGELEVAVDR